MPRTIQITTTVLPGHRIEVQAPELPEGSQATVIITLPDEALEKRPYREVLGDYTGGKLFKSGEEVEAYIKSERDPWDK
jgi:hypothetical protein